MSISALLLGIWLVLVGLVYALEVNISTEVLGWWALITGVVWLLELAGVLRFAGRQHPNA